MTPVTDPSAPPRQATPYRRRSPHVRRHPVPTVSQTATRSYRARRLSHSSAWQTLPMSAPSTAPRHWRHRSPKTATTHTADHHATRCHPRAIPCWYPQPPTPRPKRSAAHRELTVPPPQGRSSAWSCLPSGVWYAHFSHTAHVLSTVHTAPPPLPTRTPPKRSPARHTSAARFATTTRSPPPRRSIYASSKPSPPCLLLYAKG